jgi:hypothetical protein
MAKRKAFDEVMEGVDAMKKRRQGKLTLRSYKEKSGRPLATARTPSGVAFRSRAFPSQGKQ